LTSELERIKILEGKISQIVEYINKLLSENKRLKKNLKELKEEKNNYVEQAKKAGQLDKSLNIFKKEREAIKEKIETIINQIDLIEL
jgi:chromosome segregation ATPase